MEPKEVAAENQLSTAVAESNSEAKADGEVMTTAESEETTKVVVVEQLEVATTPTEQEQNVPPSESTQDVPAAPADVGSTIVQITPLAESGGDRRKRIYVGNLAWEVSWKDLKEHMKSTGLEVTHASIMTTPDGRSKGCGIVEFETADAAQEALTTLNDTELKGRQIFVREDREERSVASTFGSNAGRAFSLGEQSQNRRVYVGNLSWDVAWQDLKDHMRSAGEVIHAEVIMEHSGRSKGCGIVEYATEEESQHAIQTLTDTELKGRMIFVREDRETVGHPPGPTIRGQNSSVYVWNLAPETSWQDLKDHMRKAGNVDSATILTNVQGESMGCGVVVYQKTQEASRAIRELQNSELKGRMINVREDRASHSKGGGGGGGYNAGRGGRGGGFGGRGPGGRGGGRHGGSRPASEEGTKLYIGNLSYQTTWKELKDHFRQCGDVRHAEVATSMGGQSKGFGFVQFANRTDAESAISLLNSSELQGRKLEVRLDQKSH